MVGLVDEFYYYLLVPNSTILKTFLSIKEVC